MLTKKGRNAEKKFLSEGVRLLEESLRHRMLPEKIIYAETIISERCGKLINKFKKKKVEVASASVSDIAYLSGTKTSQGILGVFKIPEYKITTLFRKSKSYLLLDNISDPGNAGTLIRSALAFEFSAVFLTSNCVEQFNPKVVRSTAGAIFGIPLVAVTIRDIIYIKKRFKVQLIIGDINGITSKIALKRLNENSTLILGIGSEAAGVSGEIGELADIKLRLTHSQKVESLNAAVAGSILMREIYDKFLGKE